MRLGLSLVSLLLLGLGGQAAFAQVTGTVTDAETGEPLPVSA